MGKRLVGLVILVGLALGFAGLAEAGWYNPSWSYRRAITLDPVTPEAYYQVKVTLANVTLTGAQLTSGNANGNDIRFTGSDGTTLQDYWIESWSATGTTVTATIWVEVITSGASTIYMYYGNPSASSASNGTNTFEFFDDFETDLTKWTTTGPPTLSTTQKRSGARSVRFAPGTDWMHRSTEALANTVLTWYMYDSGETSGIYLFGGVYDTLYIGIITSTSANYYVIWGWPAGGYAATTLARTTGWHKVSWNAVDRKGYIDDTLVYTFSAGSTTGIQLGSWAASTVAVYIDDVFVRKYASPEPTATVGGKEEMRVRGGVGIGAPFIF